MLGSRKLRFKFIKNVSNFNDIKIGQSILAYLQNYKSNAYLKRVSKKDLIYHGRFLKFKNLRYINIFYGRCVNIKRNLINKQITLRCYFGKNNGMTVKLFLNSPNFLKFYIMDLHRRFRRYKRRKIPADFRKCKKKHISKLKRLSEY